MMLALKDKDLHLRTIVEYDLHRPVAACNGLGP
jgi:hypothetical protein